MPAAPGEVLLVSKPVAPPWNDSSKNLVRDLARAMERHTPIVLGRTGEAPALGRARVEPLYPKSAGHFAPRAADNARVLLRLLAGRRADLWHFFFAPNPRTSVIGSLTSRIRRAPTVQTVCSAPREGADLRRLLFADRTIVLSAHTEERLVRAGVDPERLRRIPAAVELLATPSTAERLSERQALGVPADAQLVVFPGDLEFGGGAKLVLEAVARLGRGGLRLVMACRAKTGAAREAERTLQGLAHEHGIADRVSWVGETARIHALLGAADVVALPSESLFAKMDHPLVLLEAMALERPVVVADGTPAAELGADGAAVVIPPRADALAGALGRLLGDDGERAARGARGRERVRRVHDPVVMARAYESVYDELLDPRWRRPR